VVHGYRNKCGSTCTNNSNNILRYNIFEDVDQSGILMGGYDTASQGEKVYQNIFLNVPLGVFMNCGNSNMQIYNNVFYRSASGTEWSGVLLLCTTGNTNLQVYNNIMRNIHSPITIATSLPSGLYIDYSSYSSYQNFLYNDSWISFSQFKTNVGNNNYVQNNVDPLFVNPTNRDFRLQANSPARNAGRNGVNMGAYITGNEIIGLISSGDLTAPSPPRNLKLQ